MDNHRTCAERIRPILQAMERSIDAARRGRVKEPMEAGHAPRMQPVARQELQPNPAIAPAHNTAGQSGRLKAKPKRIDSSFGSSFQPSFR